MPVPELDRRRAALEAAGGYRPQDRVRQVSAALRAYAAFALSADKGAVRVVPEGPVTVTGSATAGGEEVLEESAALIGTYA